MSLYTSRLIKYEAFIVKTDCIKKFGGISQKNIQKQNNGSYAFTNVFDLFVQNQGSDY